MRDAYSKAKEELQKAREARRNGSGDDEKLKAAEKAAEKAVDDAYKALKDLDERSGVSKYLILTVTENGFGKRTDIDEYRLTARAAQGRQPTSRQPPRWANPRPSFWWMRPRS